MAATIKSELNVEETMHFEEPGKLKIEISRDTFDAAQSDSLAAGKPQWQVIKENLRVCLVTLVVQVSGPRLHVNNLD